MVKIRKEMQSKKRDKRAQKVDIKKYIGKAPKGDRMKREKNQY